MTDSETVDLISKLHEVDPVFREVVDLLFGDAVDPREAYDISKMNDGSEMHVKTTFKGPKKPSDRTQRQVTAGLSAVGAGAGAAGLAYAGRDVRQAIKDGTKIRLRTKGLLAAEVAGLGGELMATKILHSDTKKVRKALDEIVKARRDGQINTETAIRLADDLVAKVGRHAQSRRSLVQRAEMAESNLRNASRASKTLVGTTAVAAAGTGYALGRRAGKKAVRRKLPLPEMGPAPTGKHRTGVDITKIYNTASTTNTITWYPSKAVIEQAEQVDYGFVGEISKVDEDKRLAFGWCSLSTVDGEPVVDLQGDYIPIEEIEKTAYVYVKDSRVGGDMHSRDGEAPKHTADLVESFVATPEKLQQMGISAEVAKNVPAGWWVGMRVNDDEQWRMVKSGERQGFSVHGKGQRVQKDIEGAA